MLKQIWSFRHFIWSSVKTDIKFRHSRSKLGLLWMFLNPLFQAALYIAVLSGVMSAKMQALSSRSNYAVYLLAGTLAWSLFSEIISRSLNLFIENAQLLKKANFPKITLSINVVLHALINNLLLMIVVLILYFAVFNITPNIYYLFLPLLILLNALLALGLGLILSSMNVFIRDVGQAAPMGLMILYWGTPIVYHQEMLPTKLQPLLAWNPFNYLVTGYHDILFLERTPDLAGITVVLASVVVVLFLGLKIFSKANMEMVDVL